MNVNVIREMYPVGTRIEIIHMDDPYAPVQTGTRGTVEFVDDMGQISMRWDNGRTLALIPEIDEFQIITDVIDNKMMLPAEVEYDIVCFERTLKIQFSKGNDIDSASIVKALDKYYDEWQNDDDPDMCLEEFMVDSVCEAFGLSYDEWDSIPYGENCGHRENLWVCEHCLMGIESKEGNQATLRHYVDEHDAIDSRCAWCRECGFDTLYELV